MESQAECIPIIQFAPKQLLSHRTLTKQVPPYADPHIRLSPRLPDLRESQRTSTDLDTDINTKLREIPHIKKV